MLGRMRPSSLDCLERPPSKIIKDDDLSIYEATLEKLRRGSRRALGSSPAEAMQIEAPCSSLSASKSSSDGQSVDCSKQQMEQEPCCSFSVFKCKMASES